MKRDINKLLSIICNCVRVTENEVRSKSRKHNIVTARHLFCYYASIIYDTPCIESTDLVGLDVTNIYDIKTKIDNKLSLNDREINSLMKKIDIALGRIEPESNPIPTLPESLKKNKYFIGVDIVSNEESIQTVNLLKIASGGTRILSSETISLRSLPEKDRNNVVKAFALVKHLSKNNL